MEAGKTFSDSVHQVVDRATDSVNTWAKNVGAAIVRHPIATALVGVSVGYLLLAPPDRRSGASLARAIARRVLVASGSLLARAAYAEHTATLH